MRPVPRRGISTSWARPRRHDSGLGCAGVFSTSGCGVVLQLRMSQAAAATSSAKTTANVIQICFMVFLKRLRDAPPPAGMARGGASDALVPVGSLHSHRSTKRTYFLKKSSGVLPTVGHAFFAKIPSTAETFPAIQFTALPILPGPGPGSGSGMLGSLRHVGWWKWMTKSPL